MKIKILSIGKTKEPWLEEACSEYIKRLSSSITLECLWAKNDSQLIEWSKREKGVLCLDPQGKEFSSLTFSDFLFEAIEKNGSKLTMIIGGAQGLPDEVKSMGVLISLSKLTYTHQMTRLILIEQIYRAFEIKKGSNYHKY